MRLTKEKRFFSLSKETSTVDKRRVNVKNIFMENLDTEIKHQNAVLGILKSFLAIIFALVAVVALWVIFSCADRKNSLSVIPRDYAAFVHTRSAWSALSPLIDLRASDEILATDDFKQFREPFLTLRESEFRNNKAVQYVLSRRIDAALYTLGAESHFVAAVDMGALSAVTRLAFLAPAFAKVEGLSSEKGESGSYLVFRDKNSSFYIKPYHNLLVLSDSKAVFDSALKANAEYSPDEVELMTKKDSQSVRITSDVRALTASLTAGSPELEAICNSVLGDKAMSSVSFAITDDKIRLQAEIPSPSESANDLQKLLSRKSEMPVLLGTLGESVQYYTLVNLGSLEELKDAFLPFAGDEKQTASLWSKADGACRLAFSMTLNDLLFSWTGKEFAVLGVEGQNDPVFAVQISDENKRRDVFSRIVASILVKDGSPFILGGARLEQLQLPSFLNGVLSLFGVKMPSPYYMVLDGFVYFSESPETLSSIYSSSKAKERLSSAKGFCEVSKDIPNEFALSLFYNLEKSVPFFLRSSSVLSKVLSLYGTGRCDIAIKDGKIILRIQSSAKAQSDSAKVSGFPIDLASRFTSALEKEPGDKASTVFWSEGGKFIKALDLHSLEIREKELSEEAYIAASDKVLKGNGVLWAVTKSGAVYLFDKKLDIVPGFPFLTSESVSAGVAAFKNSVVIPTESASLCFVDDETTSYSVALNLNGSIKSKPSVSGDSVCVYDKSFRGQILFVKDKKVVNEENPLSVPGIAFGSPSLIEEKDSSLKSAFITQSGALYLWRDGEIAEGFPIRLEGNFRANVAADSQYIYALSSSARLYRISADGSVLDIQIPKRSAEEGGVFTVDDKVFVSVDGNIIYGFDSNLELISKFPLPGFGKPVFADVNGDKKKECIVLSLDKKIYAWNAR